MNAKKEIEKLTMQVNLMRCFNTDLGFFIAYYEVNLTNNDKVHSFNEVNRIYKELFGVNRYSDLNDFFKKGIKFQLN